MHVHLIGIGGSGLSAIAKVLLQKGYQVSGSDRQDTLIIQGLRNSGARVFIGHHPDNLAGADVVLRSSAVGDENVEVRAAQAAQIPVLKRSDILERLMEGQECIAIAGTHGKTTTTAMAAWLLNALGQDPSYIIGGTSLNLGNNARAGKGQYFVIEADEYDYMFLGLQPKICILTNIEHDHPDCFPTYQNMLETFRTFINRIVPSGILIACGEDAGALAMLDLARGYGMRTFSYGIGPYGFDYYADGLASGESGGYRFTLSRREGEQLVELVLQVPGEHNVRNALAVLALADSIGLPLPQSARALEEFKGTARRFEVVGEIAGVTVINDYAHHPSEIRATLAAARVRYSGRRIWAVWQPHTYSRTRQLFNDFVAAFEKADHVVVTEIYAARENLPQDGFSAQQVVAAMSYPDAYFVPDLTQVTSFLLGRLLPGDVLLVLSAGDADQISTHVLASLMERSNANA